MNETEKTPVPYPGIARAALLIALDNGGINRDRSERQQARDLARWLKKQPPEILPPIDAWLGALSEDDLETACCGEVTEADAVLASAPPFTSDLLNRYFEDIC